jgi:hypothetical protein
MDNNHNSSQSSNFPKCSDCGSEVGWNHIKVTGSNQTHVYCNNGECGTGSPTTPKQPGITKGTLQEPNGRVPGLPDSGYFPDKKANERLPKPNGTLQEPNGRVPGLPDSGYFPDKKANERLPEPKGKKTFPKEPLPKPKGDDSRILPINFPDKKAKERLPEPKGKKTFPKEPLPKPKGDASRIFPNNFPDKNPKDKYNSHPKGDGDDKNPPAGGVKPLKPKPKKPSGSGAQSLKPTPMGPAKAKPGYR